MLTRLMKVNYNMMRNFGKIFKVLFGGVIIAGFLVPVLLLAQGNAERGICARLSTLSSKIDERSANFNSKLEARRNEITSKIESAKLSLMPD